MINANEHKKLLKQVAELEKNSTNFFDVEKEFFLIDSDNLPQVRPQMNDLLNRQDLRSIDFDSDNLSRVRSRLYGYSIQRSGIYENDNLTPEAIAGLDGRGCYVYVEVKDDEITIKQDLNGCWGIYLFRHGDYFALSNSFFRLVEHVKFKYPLTVNRDYCHHMIITPFVGFPCFETAVNEIRLLERNAIVHINTMKKTLETELIDYKEYTVMLDSEEGIAKLDKWVDYWGAVFRGLVQHTKFISADLSAGFDSRITFLLLLHSGIDCNQVQINSTKSNFHTYPKDYETASRIVEHYGLKLNQPLPQNQALNYSLSDVWKIDLYHRRTIHKVIHGYATKKYVEKIYSLNGYAGESLRGYYMESPQKVLEGFTKFGQRYSRNLCLEVVHSSEKIFKSAFRFVCDKYKIEDTNSIHIPQLMYLEIRNRNHFGKHLLGFYFKNTISLSPAIDPEVRTLRLNTPECPDPKLLIALLFVRYEPDLLMFPFNNNSTIAPETIEYAKQLNERFPRRLATNKVDGGGVFYLSPHDFRTEQLLQEKNNKNLLGDIFTRCVEAEFYSTKTFGTFTTYFDEEIYQVATSRYESKIVGSYRNLYMISGIAKVLEDVIISNRNRPLWGEMTRFLEQDFATIHKTSQIPAKFEPFITARLEIKLMSTEGDFQIIFLSDEKAAVDKPNWFQTNGVGYMIHSSIGNLEIIAKATTDGQIRINLRGMGIRTPEDNSKYIPYWIDYTKLVVNDKPMFDTLTPAWHNEPYKTMIEVKANEEIKIQMEWLPHRSDT